MDAGCKNDSEDDDDDVPTLSKHTLAALQDFYEGCEQQQRSVGSCEQEVGEDWQLSQFWYSEATAQTLAREAIAVAQRSDTRRIACLCTPTVYKHCRQQLHLITSDTANDITTKLFEFDTRFKIYGDDFEFYDYKQPLEIGAWFQNYFDIVIVDPPFLSEECLRKVSISVKYLTTGKIVLCTGSIMGELAEELLNVRPGHYRPEHTRNLANDFTCYTNYNAPNLGGNGPKVASI